LSPRMSVRYWAIFFCWTTLQWFSMDRITGYLWSQSKRSGIRPRSQGRARPHVYRSPGHPYHWVRKSFHQAQDMGGYADSLRGGQP
jgi:hypothetical protein